MIRLIQRRLIIPQGDTGTFTIPTQGSVDQGDIAILAIYDPLLQKTVCQKKIEATNETLTFNFAREDTINLEPSNRYVWDIVIYRGVIYDENTQAVIAADSADSYYSAFKLPICEIRRATPNVYQQS